MRRKRKLFAVIIVSAILLTLIGISELSNPARAVEQKFIPEINYSRFELDNGFEVYVVEDDSIPVINYSLYYDVGSISHLLPTKVGSLA